MKVRVEFSLHWFIWIAVYVVLVSMLVVSNGQIERLKFERDTYVHLLRAVIPLMQDRMDELDRQQGEAERRRIHYLGLDDGE